MVLLEFGVFLGIVNECEVIVDIVCCEVSLLIDGFVND